MSFVNWNYSMENMMTYTGVAIKYHCTALNIIYHQNKENKSNEEVVLEINGAKKSCTIQQLSEVHLLGTVKIYCF